MRFLGKHKRPVGEGALVAARHAHFLPRHGTLFPTLLWHELEGDPRVPTTHPHYPRPYYDTQRVGRGIIVRAGVGWRGVGTLGSPFEDHPPAFPYPQKCQGESRYGMGTFDDPASQGTHKGPHPSAPPPLPLRERRPTPEEPEKFLRVGLIGDPVAHSYSPRFQQAALDALGIPAGYELWQTSASELPTRMASLRDPRCLGANVTIPHKEAVLALLDAVDPLAALIGAVNTIVHRDGLLLGYNTDAPGLLHALAEQGVGEPADSFSLEGYTAVLLGAGGAARGAAFALSSASITRLIIVNRHLDRAQRLAAEVQQQSNCQALSLNDPDFLLPDARSLIINATSLGMHEDAGLLSEEVLGRFARDTLVFDMIYNPRETKLLRQARARGLRAVNGLPMLLHQGALAFSLWTDQPAPLEVMRGALM